MDLNDTLIFTKIVEHEGISAAARALSVPKSKVSRRLSELEGALNTILIERSTRSIRLTEAGRLFFQHSKRIVDEAEHAQQSLAELLDVPRGLLRISCSISMGQRLMAPYLAEFCDQYPEIEIDMQLNNRRIDLIGDDFDVAIRVGKLDDSNLVARRLGRGRAVMYASPDYLSKHGQVLSIQDLGKHRCLVMKDAIRNTEWLLEHVEGQLTVNVNVAMTINDFHCLYEAALGGAGIVLMPDYLASSSVREGRLVRVLSEWSSPTFSYYAMYASRRGMTQKLSAFLDFYQARFEQLGRV